MPTETEPKFKIGDVVQLKSGGPMMTVRCNDHGKITVQWFSSNCQAHEIDFLAELLELASIAPLPEVLA
jgi:uncharacterized protein YodC (DUF2158 family)